MDGVSCIVPAAGAGLTSALARVCQAAPGQAALTMGITNVFFLLSLTAARGQHPTA